MCVNLFFGAPFKSSRGIWKDLHPGERTAFGEIQGNGPVGWLTFSLTLVCVAQLD